MLSPIDLREFSKMSQKYCEVNVNPENLEIFNMFTNQKE